jgi:hypothetical protein
MFGRDIRARIRILGGGGNPVWRPDPATLGRADMAQDAREDKLPSHPCQPLSHESGLIAVGTEGSLVDRKGLPQQCFLRRTAPHHS